MDKPAPLHPSIKTLWWTVAFGITVPIAASLSVLGWVFEWPVLAWAAPSIVLLGLAAVLPPFIYARWRYQIRDEDVYTSRGTLFYTQTLVPFDRIQFVETRQGPLDRVFKLAQVIVYTAAGKAGRIPGLEIAEAESLRDHLSKVAGTQSV